MNICIRVITVVVSMLFVVSLCAQAWARAPMVRQDNTEPEKEYKEKQEIQTPKVPRVVKCGPKTATIVGTNGNDNMQGTPGDDVIHGLGGNDVIYGGGGNDWI